MERAIKDTFKRFLRAFDAFEQEFICEERKEHLIRPAELAGLVDGAKVEIDGDQARIVFGVKDDEGDVRTCTLVREPTGWKVKDLC